MRDTCRIDDKRFRITDIRYVGERFDGIKNPHNVFFGTLDKERKNGAYAMRQIFLAQRCLAALINARIEHFRDMRHLLKMGRDRRCGIYFLTDALGKRFQSD